MNAMNLSGWITALKLTFCSAGLWPRVQTWKNDNFFQDHTPLSSGSQVRWP